MKKYILGFLVLFGLDFATKAWALIAGLGTAFPTERMVENPIFLKYITSFFNFILVRNTGVSFSIFSNLPSQLPLILFTIFIIIWLFYWFIKEEDSANKWAIIFIISGAVGNVIDRIRFSGVIDFIDWHYASYHWPTFNVADIWISFGALIYVVFYFYKKKKIK